jgi:hypothetical protein
MSVFDFVSPRDANWRTAVDDFKWYRVERFILHLKRWQNYAASSGPTLKWESTRFSKEGVKKLPHNKMGIYTFVAEPQIAGHTYVRYLLYVGKAEGQSLQDRVTSYLYEPRVAKPRVHVSEMVTKFGEQIWIYYAVVDDISSITNIEDQLLQAFIPPFNRDFPATMAQLYRANFS